MHRFIIGTIVGDILAFAAVGLASPADAAPTGGTSAADTVKTLQDMGYAVQINGSVSRPLAQCNVTGVHGLLNTDATGGRIDPTEFSTAYVDVACPGSDD
jgi:hypothetical protein